MKKQLKTTAKTMLAAAWEATVFCFRNAPLRFTVQTLSELLFTILPFAVLYNWQNLINTVTQKGVIPEVWLMAGFYIAVLVFQLAMETLNTFLDKLFCERLDNRQQVIIMKKMSSLDVGKFYDPEFQDAMSVVNDFPGYPYLFSSVRSFIKSFIIAVVSVAGVAKGYPIAALLIVLCYIPAVVIRSRNAVTQYNLYRSEENDQRKSNYYRDVLTGRDTAAELRLYGFEDLFRGRYNDIWKKLYKAHLRLKRKQTGWELFGELIGMAGLVFLLLFLLADIKIGAVSAGDVSLYIGLALTLMNSVGDTGFAFSCFHMNYMQCAGKLKAFLTLTSALDETGDKKITHIPEIEFRNVSFHYPGKEEYVLKNISFRLSRGEKLALVGINGAGKTTLTKLLCRFYDPTEGEILFDGINAKEFDIHSLRSVFGIMFQDSITYTLSLKDNIMLSDIYSNDEDRFRQACVMSSVDSVTKKLENGYGTEIGRLWNGNNYEPSGGERQKIGLARAYYKDAKVIILDEPSSALDAEAEDHIFRKFSELCRDKSAVLISHRLSAVSMADKVALLENGEMSEFGTHRELMDRNGRYAALYRMQAESYMERKGEDYGTF